MGQAVFASDGGGSLRVFRESIKRWYLCLLSSAFLGYTIIQMLLLNAFHGELTKLLHLSATQMGYLSSVFTLALTIILIPAGILFDILSTRKLFLFAALISVVASGLFWLYPNYWCCFLNRGLAGIGNAFAFIGGLRLMGIYYHERRALAIGLFISLGNLGGMLATGPYIFLKAWLTWQQVLGLNFLLGVLLLLLMTLSLRISEPTPRQAGGFAQQLRGFLQQLTVIVRSRYNWICGLYAGIFSMPATLLASLWGVLYVSQRFSFSEHAAGVTISCLILGIGIGAPLVGGFADRFGKVRLLMSLGSVSCLILTSLIAYVDFTSVTWLAIVMFLLGMCACSEVLAFSFVQTWHDKQFISTSTAFVTLLLNVIISLGLPFFGYVLSLHWDGQLENGVPLYNMENLKQAMSVIVVGFALSYLLILLLRPIRQVKRHPQLDHLDQSMSPAK